MSSAEWKPRKATPGELAALEQAAEPVAAVPSDSVVVPRKLVEDCLDGMKYSVQWERDRDGRPPSQICCFAIQDLESLLSAAPQPARKPMTDEEANKLMKWLKDSRLPGSCGWIDVIRAAERFHQIKE